MAGKPWGKVRRLPSGRVQASYVAEVEPGVRKRFNADHTFTDDPKTAYKPRTGEQKAQAWLRQVRAEIENGTWENPVEKQGREAEAKRQEAEAEQAAAVEIFSAYASAWIAQRRSGKGDALRPKTAAEYRRQLSKGLAEFAGDRLTAITPARVRGWHSSRAAVAPTAAGAEARLLQAIMNTALVDGIIERNPVPGNLTRTTTGKVHRPPTMDELGVILATIEPRFALAVLLSAYGGLRLSEWRALRRRDLTEDGVRFLVTIERQAQFVNGAWIVGPPKSAEGERVVSLPAWASVAVTAHLSEYVGAFPDDLMFAPAKGVGFIHDSAFRDAWNPAREAAGVRVPVGHDMDGNPTAWENTVREHDLRAFAGTLHAQSGATLRETMAFLGHSTTQAAMGYQHAAEDRLREIADRMPAPKVTARPTVARIDQPRRGAASGDG